jgi:hypothetical protein
VSLGAVTAAWGVGASLSNFVAGEIASTAGYDTAFLSLGAIAGAGLLLYLFAMPETAASGDVRASEAPDAASPPATGVAAPGR